LILNEEEILKIIRSEFNSILTLDGNHFDLRHAVVEFLVKKYMKDKTVVDVHLQHGGNMRIRDLLEMPQMAEINLDLLYDEEYNKKVHNDVKRLYKTTLGEYDYYHDVNNFAVTYNDKLIFLSIFQVFTDTKLGKSVIQQNLWRDRKNKFHNSDDTKHLPFSIINDYFFNKLKCDSIISDKAHTHAGKNYWKSLIQKFSHLTTGYVVGSKIHEINNDTDLDSLWGDTDEFTDIQLFITKKEINFDLE
jgi:hypothetical protein